MKNILVTGSSGFIGHNIVRMLDGHDVIGIDNHDLYTSLDPYEHDELIAERQSLTLDTQFIEYDKDLRCDYLSSVSDLDALIHTASFPRQYEVANDVIRATQTMTMGLWSALEMAKGCKKFVFISSSMVYGDFPNFVTEDHYTNPSTLYGILKETGEKIVKNHCTSNGIPYVIIRPSAVYGERDVSNRLVGKFLNAAIRDEVLSVKGPDEILDFTYVEDLAQGIVQATFSENTNNKTYNLTRSDERCRTILEAGELAIALAGSGRLEIQKRDAAFPKRGNLSIERARNDFGYNPTTNIEEGFRRYYEWLNSVFQRQATV